MSEETRDPAGSGEPPQLEEPDPAAIESLAQKLEQYASTLSERERSALMVMIYCAMDPLERIRLREGELFSDEEKALLDGL